MFLKNNKPETFKSNNRGLNTTTPSVRQLEELDNEFKTP